MLLCAGDAGAFVSLNMRLQRFLQQIQPLSCTFVPQSSRHAQVAVPFYSYIPFSECELM